MFGIAIALFFLGVSFFIFQHEMPEHRAAGRKGMFVFHGVLGLASLAIGLGMLWMRFGENILAAFGR